MARIEFEKNSDFIMDEQNNINITSIFFLAYGHITLKRPYDNRI